MKIQAYAAPAAGKPFELIQYDPGELKADEVHIRVEYCGICHSDLSMWKNEWGMTKFPFVPGHEATGVIEAVGEQARGLKVGQRVGLGWTAKSCLHCDPCIEGQQHLCSTAQGTIVRRHGAFASHVRAQWPWVIALPDAVDASAAGPLMCGGITVFSPLLHLGIKPTDRVGVVGIGGLGHMAIMFAAGWGCEVTAFTSSAAKHEEARKLGAHRVVSSTDAKAIKALDTSLDLLLVTVNVPLDWNALLATLRPQGRLHILGAVLQPIPVPVMILLMKQAAISSSPTGSPGAIRKMLDFAGRHAISPIVEHFPMSQVNEAMKKLENGKPRYRIVLDSDFAKG